MMAGFKLPCYLIVYVCVCVLQLVSRYMEVQCCGYLYNRANVEEHRLSMRHLKVRLINKNGI